MDVAFRFERSKSKSEKKKMQLKGEVSRDDVTSKPKNLCLTTETKNNRLVLS